jgi:hypothetical protein
LPRVPQHRPQRHRRSFDRNADGVYAVQQVSCSTP